MRNYVMKAEFILEIAVPENLLFPFIVTAYFAKGLNKSGLMVSIY